MANGENLKIIFKLNSAGFNLLNLKLFFNFMNEERKTNLNGKLQFYHFSRSKWVQARIAKPNFEQFSDENFFKSSTRKLVKVDYWP